MIETILKGINNRDIASFFWVLAISLLMIVQSYRKNTGVFLALKAVIKSVLNKKLTTIFLIFLLSTLCSVYFLKFLNLWDFSQVKNTFLWIIFTGLSFIGKSFSSQNYKLLLKSTILTNLKLLIFLEFFINLYVFSLSIEIFLVFITTFLVILSVFSERRTEVNEVKAHKTINMCIFIIVVLLSTITFFKFINNPEFFLNRLNFLNLITPINLTILSLPSILLLFIVKSYEEFFAYYSQCLKHSNEAKNIKITIIKRVNIKINNLNKLRKLVASKNIITLQGIHEAISLIEKHNKLEANPPAVSLQQGWSPYLALNFLTDKEIQCSFYKPIDIEEWFASSNSYELSSFLNNIFYYISGTENYVTRLSLKLSITDISTQQEDIDKFCMVISHLYLNATNEKIQDIIIFKVLSVQNFEITHELYKISVEINNYMYNNGFSINFIMKNHNHIN